MSGRLLRALGVVLAALAGACMTAEAQTMKITSITFSAPSPLKAGERRDCKTKTYKRGYWISNYIR